MRFHYIDRAQATETLCGAAMPARYTYLGDVKNAPTAVVGVEAFERINTKNRCIKCNKLLPRLKRKRQIAGERAMRRHLEEEAYIKRLAERERLGKMTDIELYFEAHEMVYGVPCGPVLGMYARKREFMERMGMLHAPKDNGSQRDSEQAAESTGTGSDLVSLESDSQQESNQS